MKALLSDDLWQELSKHAVGSEFDETMQERRLLQE